MIYLDNAATTGHKPTTVVAAVNSALVNMSANPGRSGHRLSQKAGVFMFDTRQKIAKMFGCEPTEVIFTANCTQSINTVIKGVLRSGDHAIISSLEHNAVARPLWHLKEENFIEYDVAQVIFGDSDATVRAFENLIRPNTRLIFCTHASNVTGEIMPIYKLAQLCKEEGILFAVDGAQSAGVIDIDLSKIGVDYFCIAPHKGLYAPMGTGILIARRPIEKTLIEGGTGSFSNLLSQPVDLPDRFESGTVNLPGIAGISAGVDFVVNKGVENIYAKEINLLKELYNQLSKNPRVRLYTEMPEKGKYLPVLSFNIDGENSMTVADYLSKNGIAVRAGLHCAPLAHKSLGTIDSGTVRVSPSVFNSERDMFVLLKCIKNYKKVSKNY